MRFLLLIHWDEKASAAAGHSDEAGLVAEHVRYAQALRESGRLVDGMRLKPEDAGVRVQVRDGKRAVTDGPFTDGREALGGYYLLECDSLEEAVEWAARCPSARHGSIEVRPEWPT